MRAYSFLTNSGLDHMPNPENLPVFWVRYERSKEPLEKQPARSAEEAARKFRQYAGPRTGKTIAVYRDDQVENRTPVEGAIPFTTKLQGNIQKVIK